MSEKIVLIGSNEPSIIDQVIKSLASTHSDTQVLLMSQPTLEANLTMRNKLGQEKTEEQKAQEFLENPDNQEKALSMALEYENLMGKKAHQFFHIQELFKRTKKGFTEVKDDIKFLEVFGFIQRDSVYENKVLFTIDKKRKVQFFLSQILNSMLVVEDLKRIIATITKDTGPIEGLPTIEEIEEQVFGGKRIVPELHHDVPMEESSVGKSKIILLNDIK